jgi:lauroyl/myristoyl acyltransferase
MKLSPVKTFHRSKPFRGIAKRVPPKWLFNLTRLRTTIGTAFYPHTKKRAASLASILNGYGDGHLSYRHAREAIIYNRWLDHLEYAWCNWAARHPEFVRIEGGEILGGLLQLGRGAVLLSGHRYGFNRMVDPILAQNGYPATRWSRPVNPQAISKRWGEGDYIQWSHMSFRGDTWHQVRMIRNFREALQQNRLVHISVRGFITGKPESLVKNRYKSFYLDAKLFTLLEGLQAPVLPCFAIPSAKGCIVLKIHPSLPDTATEMMQHFARLYAEVIDERPELARFLRRIARGDQDF